MIFSGIPKTSYVSRGGVRCQHQEPSFAMYGIISIKLANTESFVTIIVGNMMAHLCYAAMKISPLQGQLWMETCADYHSLNQVQMVCTKLNFLDFQTLNSYP